jgi:hypothetical protein
VRARLLYDGAMSELTFRDFAGAIMGNDTTRASEVLADLLGLDPAAGLGATKHFQANMAADASFLGRAAMGLRQAVTTGTDEEIRVLLAEYFGLAATAVPAALAALRTKYPKA